MKKLSSCGAEREIPACEAESLLFSEAELFHTEIQKALLDGGKTTAIRKGFTVRYYSEENELIGETVLLAEGIEEEKSVCAFSNGKIFLAEKEGVFLKRTDGEWKFCGGIFFERDGKIIRELPFSEPEDSSDDIIGAERFFWLGEDILGFYAGERIFFYRISEDKTYLFEYYSEAENRTVIDGKGVEI